MRIRTWSVVVVTFLLLGGIQVSAFAASRGVASWGFGGGFHSEMHDGMHGGSDHDFDGGIHRGRFRGGVFAGPAFGSGWGWGAPWLWDPYYYMGPDVVEAHPVNHGTVEFKVKPKSTKVYVDQKFIGTVNELDHHKAFLAAGNHDIKLVAPDGQTLDRTLYIAAGKKIKIDETL